jgi:negative regulator of flagellin synthesis FlgM
VKIDNIRPGINKATQRYADKVSNNQGTSNDLSKAGGIQKQSGVQISETAKLLNKAKMALSEMPDVREAKVEQIRNAIANGTYKTDSAALAEKLAEKLRSE